MKQNPFLHIFVFIATLILITVIAGIGLFYYVFAIPEPEGLSPASWPHTFTKNFTVWMESENGTIKIKATGLKRLDEYGLWLQVVDESGQEAFSYNTPENCPVSYSASELIALSTSSYQEDGTTVFINCFEDSGKAWNYLIGFPYAIGKRVLYYNAENIERLSPVFHTGILVIFCAIILFVLIYGLWLTSRLSKITKSIESISRRTYAPLKEKGIFSRIYGALNRMEHDLRQSDAVQKDTDRIRTEWITNITHDLKTPLSPVKGYAELLAYDPQPKTEAVQEYGDIILKNVNTAEKLINDLKLTYQLDSGTMPFNPQEVQLTRYLKELIIDIVNDPAFSNRDIKFESKTENLTACIDLDLFRRAVQNLIINALTHNPPETKVTVATGMAHQKGVYIFIHDNGTGMSDTEQAQLWNRYYRGTNTKEKPEGSGLGLAIAKQIVTLHGGKITVESKLNKGTRFSIFLPDRKK